MSVADYLMLAIRWLHTMSAVAWVGGGMFYLLVLRPAIRHSGPMDRSLAAAIGHEFRGLVDVSIAVLIITGAILTFDRLTSTFVGAAYAVVLASKVALAFYAFYLVRFLRRSSYPEEPEGSGRWPTPPRHALHRGHSNTGCRCDSVPAVRAIGRAVPGST